MHFGILQHTCKSTSLGYIKLRFSPVLHLLSVTAIEHIAQLYVYWLSVFPPCPPRYLIIVIILTAYCLFVYCACILYCTDLVSLVLECHFSYLSILYIVLLIIELVVNKGCLSPKL